MQVFTTEIIKEASVLNAQIEKGVIVLPAIASFLSKITTVDLDKPKRKSRKEKEEEEIMMHMAKMAARKKPLKKTA